MKKQEKQLPQQEDTKTIEIKAEKDSSDIQVPNNLTDQGSISFYKSCTKYLEKVDSDQGNYWTRKEALTWDQETHPDLLNKIISDAFFGVRFDAEIDDDEQNLDRLKGYVAAVYKVCADVPIILSMSENLLTTITEDLVGVIGQEETNQVMGDIIGFSKE
jgi:hypothetical protein